MNTHAYTPTATLLSLRKTHEELIAALEQDKKLDPRGERLAEQQRKLRSINEELTRRKTG